MSRRPSAASGTSPAMRGALLIGVAVLLGAGLLANGFRDDNSISSPGSHTSTTVRSTVPSTTPTSIVQHDPAQVKVLVLNGSGKAGVAKTTKDQLAAANYTMLEPDNIKGGGTATASIVYFVAGYDADAQAIAAKLGLPAGAVQPLPTPVPSTIADPKDANVIVIIGSDAPVAGGAGAGTTPSTAAAN